MSVTRGRRCVEPIRSVETRSGHTRVVTLLRAVPVTSLTTKAAAVKVTLRLFLRVGHGLGQRMGWVMFYLMGWVGTWIVQYVNVKTYATVDM